MRDVGVEKRGGKGVTVEGGARERGGSVERFVPSVN